MLNGSRNFSTSQHQVSALSSTVFVVIFASEVYPTPMVSYGLRQLSQVIWITPCIQIKYFSSLIHLIHSSAAYQTNHTGIPELLFAFRVKITKLFYFLRFSHVGSEEIFSLIWTGVCSVILFLSMREYWLWISKSTLLRHSLIFRIAALGPPR